MQTIGSSLIIAGIAFMVGLFTGLGLMFIVFILIEEHNRKEDIKNGVVNK